MVTALETRLRGLRLSNASVYSLLALAALAIFAIGYGPVRMVRGVAPSATGDGMLHIMVAKAIIDQGWYWFIDRLSAPFILPMIMFPVGGMLDSVIMRCLAVFFHDPFALITWFFATVFALSSVTAAYVLRTFGLSWRISLIFGLMFAFAPFPFARSTNHLMLSMYLVPFAVGFCVHLLNGSFLKLTRHQKAIYFASAVALGLNYIYMSFFASFFVALVTLLQLFRPRASRALFFGLAFLALTVISTALIYLPSAIVTARDPIARAEVYGFKILAEADIHGLKIKHLLLPPSNSSFPIVARAYQELTTKFPLEHENMFARLGIVGAIGFVILLISGALLLTRPVSIGPVAGYVLGPLATLLIAGVFFATIGGFGSIFNTFVTPEIRAYNRISPFLLFMCVAASALMFSRLISRFSYRIQIALLIVALALALAEQTDFRKLRAEGAADLGKVLHMRSLVGEVEQRLPRNAAIYQMPFNAFPHVPFVHQMQPNEHLLPYSVSTHLRWSWPALSGSAILLNRHLARLPAPQLAEALAILDFSAVWINRSGYPDRGASLVADLTKAGLTPLVADAADHIVTLDLAPVRARIAATLGPSDFAEKREKLVHRERYAIGETIDFSRTGESDAVVGPGWGPQEDDHRWTLGPRAEIKFTLAPATRESFVLRFAGSTFLPGSRPRQSVTVMVNGREAARFSFVAGQGAPDMAVPVEANWLGPDRQISITLLIDDPRSPKELGLSTDDRAFGLQLQSIAIEPATAPKAGG